MGRWPSQRRDPPANRVAFSCALNKDYCVLVARCWNPPTPQGFSSRYFFIFFRSQAPQPGSGWIVSWLCVINIARCIHITIATMACTPRSSDYWNTKIFPATTCLWNTPPAAGLVAFQFKWLVLYIDFRTLGGIPASHSAAATFESESESIDRRNRKEAPLSGFALLFFSLPSQQKEAPGARLLQQSLPA